MIECVVAASILIGVMSLVASMIYRTNLIWKDVHRQRVAVCELSNQLESLTTLSIEEAQMRIQSLECSPKVAAVLADVQLQAQWIDDALGPRISLEISWKSTCPVRPVSMTAWMHQGEIR